MTLVKKFGGEFNVLLEIPIKDIAAVGGEIVADAIQRVRNGKAHIDAGYDGIFGTVKIFSAADRKKHEQSALFRLSLRGVPPARDDAAISQSI